MAAAGVAFGAPDAQDAPDEPPAPAVNKDPGPSVRVMSFNIRYGTANDGPDRWEARRDLLTETIRAFDPDLLGVQEALDFQVGELRDELKGYAVVGVGRDDGKAAGEFTAVYFKSDRFEKVGGGHFWLSPTPDKPGSVGWDAALTRMASWVRLRDKRAGDEGVGEFLFVNTHWDHMGRRARAESAGVIRREAQKLRAGAGDDAPIPVIIAGDFNCTEDDEPYARLLRPEDAGEPALVDSYRQAHPEHLAAEATFHGFRGGREGSRIDWILHSPEFDAVRAEIDHTQRDGRYPSDHYGSKKGRRGEGEILPHAEPGA
jgi:endonuclease/exonuclease/phosphatase family metal-dependent hydrolase